MNELKSKKNQDPTSEEKPSNPKIHKNRKEIKSLEKPKR